MKKSQKYEEVATIGGRFNAVCLILFPMQINYSFLIANLRDVLLAIIRKVQDDRIRVGYSEN